MYFTCLRCRFFFFFFPNPRVATGDYFFITSTTSFLKIFSFSSKPMKKKLQLFLFWKSGRKMNKNTVAWHPCHYPTTVNDENIVSSQKVQYRIINRFTWFESSWDQKKLFLEIGLNVSVLEIGVCDYLQMFVCVWNLMNIKFSKQKKDRQNFKHKIKFYI